MVSVVVLRIEVPDERRAGPDGSHQRIFTADEVQVAGPEQPIELPLGQQRKHHRAQQAAPGSSVEQRCRLPRRGAGGDEQQGRRRRQQIEQLQAAASLS